MDSGKRTVVTDVDDLRYDDIEVVETEVEKQVPKTVTKTVEKEENDDDENKDENAAKTDESINSDDTLNDSAGETSADNDENVENTERNSTTEVTETIYETVIEKVTEEKKKGTYKDFDISGLYYNTGNDKLYVYGCFRNYEADNLLNDKSVNYAGAFAFKGKKNEFIESFPNTTINGNFSDGRMIVLGLGCYIIDENGKKLSSVFDAGSWQENSLAFPYGNYLYYVIDDHCTVYFRKYSFSKGGYEVLNRENGNYFGICDNEIYRWYISAGKISKSDINGNISYIDDIDTINGLDVKDFKKIQYTERAQIMYISKKYGFTFYDSNNKCWRYIRKQK